MGHLESCVNLPADISQEMANLKTSTSLSSVLRRYYVLAAKALGMVDTAEGIRMSGETLSIASTGDLNKNNADVTSSATFTTQESSEEKTETSRKRKPSTLPDDTDNTDNTPDPKK